MLHRRITYYSLLSTYVADAYASSGESMMHLTLWSWFLQMLYFELPLGKIKDEEAEKKEQVTTTKSITSPWVVHLLHGPAFAGAHALFAMYLWTLYANPDMEFDLAPPARPAGWAHR